MICRKCFKRKNDKLIHRHHIYPFHLGGEDKDGTIYICKDCHKEIHQYIDRLGYIKKVTILKLTKDWLSNKVIGQANEMPICPICKTTERRLFIHKIMRGKVILLCSSCGHKEESGEYLKYHLKKAYKESIKDIQKIYVKQLNLYNKEEEDESI